MENTLCWPEKCTVSLVKQKSSIGKCTGGTEKCGNRQENSTGALEKRKWSLAGTREGPKKQLNKGSKATETIRNTFFKVQSQLSNVFCL
ncbi:hypothetical protein [Roseimarinus sediminis]|uniref:hypothetical protein n=1 Tax=Roseimarinus sediminis TaxID=1610899 RepID=UPI003D1B2FB7